MGDRGSNCCCAVPPGPWFDLLIFAASPSVGNRSGYFGGPLGVLAGLRKTGSTTVPYGFTDDGLNTSGSELAFDRYGTDGGRSWADGVPPLRFDLQGVLQDLVDAADAYEASSYKCAWIAAMFDRDGAGSWAIVEGDVKREFFIGDTFADRRQVWCKLDDSGAVTDSLSIAKLAEYNTWQFAGNSTNRPDHPWRGFGHHYPSGATVSWSADILAHYAGETVTTFDGTDGLYDRRTEAATREYYSDTVGVFYVPGVEVVDRTQTTTPIGFNSFFQDSIGSVTRSAGTGPSSTTAYSAGSSNFAVYSYVVTPSPYYPRGLVAQLNDPGEIDYIDGAFQTEGVVTEPVLPRVHLWVSVQTQTTSIGFGYRATPGRNAVLETTLNEYVSKVLINALNIEGDDTHVHEVDGSAVANEAAAVALCPTTVDFHRATDSADLAVYANGGRRSVSIASHTTTPDTNSNGVSYTAIDDVTFLHEWESSIWQIRLNSDEVEIHRDTTLGTNYHLADFGDFTAGGADIHEIDVTTTGGRPLRTLNIGTPAYTPGDYIYTSIGKDNFYLFPGEPLAGEAKMAVVYGWDGPAYHGVDILLMTDPETVIGVYRLHAAKVGPGPYPAVITVRGTTSQGIYFNSTFAFRDGKGTIPLTSGPWSRVPLHPANGADAAGTSFSSGRNTVAEQQLIRYGKVEGQTFIDKSYATDAATDWVGF